MLEINICPKCKRDDSAMVVTEFQQLESGDDNEDFKYMVVTQCSIKQCGYKHINWLQPTEFEVLILEIEEDCWGNQFF